MKRRSGEEEPRDPVPSSPISPKKRVRNESEAGEASAKGTTVFRKQSSTNGRHAGRDTDHQRVDDGLSLKDSDPKLAKAWSFFVVSDSGTEQF